MEQRCVQLFGSEREKILQCHCTLCQEYLFPMEPLCSKGVFHFFSFFWHDFESKNGWGAFIRKLSESLKARQLRQSSLFLRPACVYWFCPGVRRERFPPENSDSFKVAPSSQNTGKAPADGTWLTAWSHGTLQNPSDNPRLRSWNNAIQSWELSPWKHMLRKGNKVLQKKKWEVKKKQPPFLPLSLWFLRKNRTVRTLGEDWRLWMMMANTFD